MKHTTKIAVASIGLFALACGPAMEQHAPETQVAGKATYEHLKASQADTDLGRMKKLAGTWVGTMNSPHEKGEQQVEVQYRVISQGTAVEERHFPGTDHEMVTMYHNDGDKVVMTHYCALGNQPKMRQVAVDGAEKLAFSFIEGANLVADKDPHMHKLEITFVGDDQIYQDWTMYKEGKPQGKTRIKLSRK